MPSNSDSPNSPSAEVEIGDSVEIIVDGKRIECFLSDNVFAIDPHSIHGRMAIRAYAYSVAGEDPATAKAILAAVGREG